MKLGKKFRVPAAALWFSAGLGLSVSGAHAVITTTGGGIVANDNDTYTTRVTGTSFEYRQISAGKVLTVSVPDMGYEYGGAFSNTTTSASVINTAGNVTFANNSASYQGGAIYSGVGGATTLTHSGGGTLAFVGNTSGHPGTYDGRAGMFHGFDLGYNYGYDALTMTGGYDAILIVSNASKYDGGAINTYSDFVTLNCNVSGMLSISGNRTNNGEGGAVVCGRLILSGSYGAIAIVSNTAGVSGGSYIDNGGAFSVMEDVLINTTVVRDLSISGNFAGADGGAMDVGRNLELKSFVGGTLNLSGNFADGFGGALKVYNTMSITGSYGAIAIVSNTTRSSGGAFYAGVSTRGNVIISATVAGNLSFNDNYANTIGGAMFVGGTFELNGSVGGTLSFSGNRAEYSGAVRANQKLILGGSYDAIVIASNTAASDSSSIVGGFDGGAFYAGGIVFSATVARDLRISGNFAGGNLASGFGNGGFGNGGALCSSYGSNITLSGSYGAIAIISNTAGGSGGAFYAHQELYFSATTASISVRNNRANRGGAFYTGDSFNLTLAASNTLSASGNYSKTGGGFLFTSSGSMRFDIAAGALAQIGDANSVANQTDSIATGTDVNNVSLYKTGAGTLQLWADNTYLGNTYVNAGVLDVRGKLASARTEVAGGAVLKGSGTLTNSVVIHSGGTLAPGSNSGVLTTGPLTLNDGAALSLTLAAVNGSGHARPAGNSLLVVNGNLTGSGTAQLDVTLTASPVNGAVYDLIKYTGARAGGVALRALSGSGAAGVDISDFKIITAENGWLKLSYNPPAPDTWDLAGLTNKGLKLSAAKTLAVPKGVKLMKGTKAVYTWQRDGVTVATGSAKTFTAKIAGTYTLTLSYTTADGQRHSQTQTFGAVKLFAQPKTATLSLTQTTDTITNSALRATSAVSGEALKLTASVGCGGGGAVGPFRYVWYSGGKIVRTQQSSATADTFITPAYGDKAVGYKCVVELVARDAKNKPLAVAKSKELKAKIILPPSAVTLSASATTVKENGTLALSASAKGTAKLVFNWYKNDKLIASGAMKKFTKKPVTASDAGVYYVVVTQDKTTRRAQSAPLTVSVQGSGGVPPPSATPAAAASPAADPRRRDAAGTLNASVLNLAPLSLSAGDVLTLSGSATREYIIVNETQHSAGAYRYEWRDNLTAEFQDIDAAADLTLRFITSGGGVYELSVSGSIGETGVFELRKK